MNASHTSQPVPDPPNAARRGPDWLRRAIAALRQDVWDIEPGGLPRARRALVRGLRIGQLVFRGFRHDECTLHASSLTFLTLLAIIPVLALGLSMARVFGAGDLAREQLKEVAREWLAEGAPVTAAPGAATTPDSADPGDGAAEASAQDHASINLVRIERLIDAGFDRIDNLNFRALGGLGLVFLLWSVIAVLGRVEAAFNRVWGVTEQRSLPRKFTDYLSVVIVVPFLVTAASTIPAVSLVGRLLHGSGPAVLQGSGLRILRMLGTLGLLTLSFSFLLRFLPNTRVRTAPSLAGGFVTAVLSMGWLRLCAAFQFGVAKNSLFFGGFATVPILLSWVYVSWEILLLGAEVSFAVQNADTYRMEQGAEKASVRTRLMVAVDLLAEASRAVRRDGGLLDLAAYLRDRRISVRLVNDVVRELVQRALLVEVASQPGCYTLRRDPGSLTVADAVRTLLDTGPPPATVGVRLPPSAPLGEPFDQTLSDMLPQRIAEL